MDILTSQYQSPAGILTLASYDNKLCMCDWTTRRNTRQIIGRLMRSLHAEVSIGSSPVINSTIRQLNEYFAHRRQQFDIPLLLCGSDFQKSVWETLANIPYGTTTSYSDIASAINRPEAVRAVANAIGANALSIIIPCHRIVGKNGALTGYAGGIEAKRRVLQCEGVVADGATVS